ncbi:type IX secretion system plug protein [Flavicella sediminum]|uniref:type IX secretion system plug protein n=1 Tax=Flavicella sediminum TaxID=2585141 RepID=UPI0014073019|nr:DUF5103 domain-containing protein [Flavicella sediminum]
MLKKYLIFVFILSLPFSLKAQNYTASFIKSVRIATSSSSDETTNIFQLGQSIYLTFDDLEADQKEYYYTIEHCNYNWVPSNLNKSEYLEGYDEFELQNFENSFNTLQNFTHYTLRFPNENTRIKISGNYLITLLNSDDQICIQRRIVLFEPITTVSAKVIRDRDLTNIDQKQVVQFSIYHPNLTINNPSNEIKTVVLQNNDWNFIKTDLHPQFYKKDEIVYNYNEASSFYGGNEFLNFDTKNRNGNHISIFRTELQDIYHHYIVPTPPRTKAPYTYFPDINGNYIVRTLNSADPILEADYSFVHLSLEATNALIDKDIYVYGAFNNFEVEENNRLVFNEASNMLEATLLLKQGFYNYSFITYNKEDKLDKHLISGSHFFTENNYTILVYYTPFGQRVGKVIGCATINSKN